MIFSSSRSFLLRKRMTDECWNHGYVMIVRNRALDSSMRFCAKGQSVTHVRSNDGTKSTTGRQQNYKGKSAKYDGVSMNIRK